MIKRRMESACPLYYWLLATSRRACILLDLSFWCHVPAQSGWLLTELTMFNKATAFGNALLLIMRKTLACVWKNQDRTYGSKPQIETTEHTWMSIKHNSWICRFPSCSHVVPHEYVMMVNLGPVPLAA